MCMDWREKVDASTAFDTPEFGSQSPDLRRERLQPMRPTFPAPRSISQIAPSRYAELLEVSKVVACHRNLDELFQDLARHLHSVVEFHYLSVVLHDPLRDVMRLHVLEAQGLGKAHPGMEFSVDESPSGWVWKNQRPLFVPDIDKEVRFSRPISIVREYGVRSFCSFPLTTPRRRLGAYSLGSRQVNAYSKSDLEVPLLVAEQVAVENALNYQEARELQRQVVRERDHLRLLLEVNNAVVSNLSLSELARAIPARVRTAMQCDAACLSLPDTDGVHLRICGLDFPQGRGFLHEAMVLPVEGTSPGTAYSTGQPLMWGRAPAALHLLAMEANAGEGFQSGCFLPLIRRDRKLGVLHLLDRKSDAFAEQDVDFLRQVASQVAIALENALEYGEISRSRERLANERLYLRDEIRTEHNFEEILGESAVLKRVLKQVETVAPAQSTVLIQGETGTGKELIARAIHNLSSRRDHIFVKLNCAAIPSGLLESELFGHEKGAFTGAISQKIGRFELANTGTLFLDEIGDIPLELQPKLLRVLQEQEFERLGSNRSLHVDVRLIAATNQDLAGIVEQNQFRADLYYRLNVFPIHLPPLRERAIDIPHLVKHFAAKHSEQMNKKIEYVPEEVLESLVQYDWPGNIRELQNLIERAVILSSGPALHVPPGELKPLRTKAARKGRRFSTLEEAEREHIAEVLRETQWVLGGADGAAARLGVPRTTLIYKMRRLGIPRQPE
ncbi:MAG TPA: sigma 54-interacting transcriptional regulator [Terriglobales bacterium]|nr:sigma 54-interacting transcriptional regulator [Terriglobales bacterium]